MMREVTLQEVRSMTKYWLFTIPPVLLFLYLLLYGVFIYDMGVILGSILILNIFCGVMVIAFSVAHDSYLERMKELEPFIVTQTFKYEMCGLQSGHNGTEGNLFTEDTVRPMREEESNEPKDAKVSGEEQTSTNP